jgi:hypothetical protein
MKPMSNRTAIRFAVLVTLVLGTVASGCATKEEAELRRCWRSFIEKGEMGPLIALGERAQPLVPELVAVFERKAPQIKAKFQYDRCLKAGTILSFLHESRAISPMINMLREQSTRSRLRIPTTELLIEALGRLGGPDVVKALLAFPPSSWDGESSAIADGLARLLPDDPSVVLDAFEEPVQHASYGVLTNLSTLARHRKWRNQEALPEAIAHSEELVGRIVAFLEHPNEEYGNAAAGVLGYFRTPAAVEAVLKAAETRDACSLEGVVQSLSEIDDPRVIPSLQGILKRGLDMRGVGYACSQAAHHLGELRAQNAIMDIIAWGRKSPVCESVHASARIGGPEAETYISEMAVGAKTEFVRECAIRELARMAGDGAFETLRRIKEDAGDVKAASALFYLATMEDPRSAQYFREALQRDDLEPTITSALLSQPRLPYFPAGYVLSMLNQGKDTTFQREAAEVLYFCGDLAERKHFVDIHHDNKKVAVAFCVAGAVERGEDGVEMLYDIFSSANGEEARVAAWALMRCLDDHGDMHPEVVGKLLADVKGGRLLPHGLLNTLSKIRSAEMEEALNGALPNLLPAIVRAEDPLGYSGFLAHYLPICADDQCVGPLIELLAWEPERWRFWPDSYGRAGSWLNDTHPYALTVDILYDLTGGNFGADVLRWRRWWATEGRMRTTALP